MKHIMIDLETMGNKSYSAIVSIGAVKFDIKTGETGETFYRNVNLSFGHIFQQTTPYSYLQSILYFF